jgi:hypothetical protein
MTLFLSCSILAFDIFLNKNDEPKSGGPKCKTWKRKIPDKGQTHPLLFHLSLFFQVFVSLSLMDYFELASLVVYEKRNFSDGEFSFERIFPRNFPLKSCF